MLGFLPQVRTFHTFGDQLFVHTDRAYSDDEVRPTSRPASSSTDGPSAGSLSPAAAEADLSSIVKGPFNFHRMIAYRFRVLRVISGALSGEQREEHLAKVVAAARAAASAAQPATSVAAGPATAPPASPAAPLYQTPQRQMATSSPLAVSTSGAPVRIANDLFPRVVVETAVARMPVSMDHSFFDCDGTRRSEGGAANAAASVPNKQPAGRMWGGRQKTEESVELLLEVSVEVNE